MTTIRNSNPNRSSVLSSFANDPMPSLITTLPRESYEAFERMAREHGFTKAAYLRKLVLEHIEASGK